MSVKEEMLETFRNIWKHASQAESEAIKSILASIMRSAQVVKWQVTQQPNEYQLELKEEIVGSHPEIPLGHLVIKKRMKIVFIEEKTQNHYRQIIHFPDHGMSFQLGIGWLSKETAIEHISFEEKDQDITCTVQALGQNIKRSLKDALAFWKKTEWTIT